MSREASLRNLKRDAGPGRPKGSKDSIPRSFKASIKQAFEDIATENPALIRAALLQGLQGKPREAFPFLQLAAFYLDGKPGEKLELAGELRLPTIVNHFSGDGE